jgi:cell division transport system permease protein
MALNVQAYFMRHAQTLVGSLGRLAREPFASFMTMAVIAIALALPLSLDLILQNALGATSAWHDAFELSVYLDRSASTARAEAIAKELQQRNDVAAVRLVTAAQALAEFRDYSGFGEALDALTDNPLPNTLLVTPSIAASTPERMDALKTAIGAIANVSSVQLDTEWVKRLVALLDLLRGVVRLAGGLLGIGVLLIVGNTIRLEILNRRAEIEVMKLVGATNRFARRPFLWTGIWYGLIGSRRRRTRRRRARGSGRAARRAIRQRISTRGARFADGRRRRACGGPARLARIMGCCNAAYPCDKPLLRD